ncbi:MAG: di-trans,poly-cis-decaprenylcistransferase [Chlamydiales bacterium]|nr:di-trans,poly-cis-decaprenylcistransferase [Chlamydiales bacterium]
MTMTQIYNTEELARLDPQSIPHHVAIIPDGNRRWAAHYGHDASYGHQHGADNLIRIVQAAKALGVKVVTFYIFSTENWNRSQDEIDALMWLLQSYLIDQCDTMIENGIRLQTIGNLSKIPKEVQDTIAETKRYTAACDQVDMVLAVNYGSRDEICRACKQIVDDCLSKKLNSSDIDEGLLNSYLDTATWSDPDLFIRTSGEKRISNFLTWQISYSELYIAEALWPEFTPAHLLEAVCCFQNRERRHGN